MPLLLVLVPKPMRLLRPIRIMRTAQNPQIRDLITAPLAPRNDMVNFQLMLTAAAISAGAKIFTPVLSARKDLSTNFHGKCFSSPQ